MNLVILQGNFGADVELRNTGTGTKVANARLATHEPYTDKRGNKVEHTEWHRLVFFGKLAEIVAKHCGKGSSVLIQEGRLQTRKWEDTAGNPRYTTEVIVRRIKFLDTKEPEYVADEMADMEAYGTHNPPPKMEDDVPF